MQMKDWHTLTVRLHKGYDQQWRDMIDKRGQVLHINLSEMLFSER